MEHFIRVGARGAEAEWKRVEDLAPAALDALESGCLFDHPDQVVTIRRLFALHVARSKGFRAIFHRTLSRIEDSAHVQNLMALLRRPEVLDALFRHHTGLEPVGEGARDLMVERTLGELVERVAGDAAFRDFTLEQYGVAQDWLQNKRLRVGVAEESEFLIGDMPVLTRSSTTGRAGILEVPLGEADTVAMPLGPKHVLALSTTEDDGYEAVPVNGVRNLNLLQLATAPEKVYFRAASGLESMAQHEWETHRQSDPPR